MNRVGRELLNVLLIVLGILSATMGIHGFLLSSNFIDGGVTGISMLLAKVTNMPLSIWLPLVNFPFIALGYRQIGRAFAIRSTLAIAGLSVSLATLHVPDVTPDLLLTAVFGGIFLGAGIGFAVRGGAVLDGTEIAALIISKRSHLLKVGDIILMFNVVLFIVAMSVLGVEESLYSILTYVSAARTLDFVIHGIEEYTAITIVSRLNGEIAARILTHLGRGVTVYKGLKVTDTRPGQWVAISGIGGLGHIAVQYARAMGLRVVAIDVDDSKLALATRLGAEVVVNASTSDVVAEVQKATGGVHGVLVTAVHPEAFGQAIGLARRGGTIVFNGLPPGDFPAPIFDIVLKGLTIRGSIVGTRQDMAEALDFYARGLIHPTVASAGLDDINDVFAKMERGQIDGRIVIDYRND